MAISRVFLLAAILPWVLSAQELPVFPKGVKKPDKFRELAKVYAEHGVKVYRPKVEAPEGMELKLDVTYATRETGALKVDLYLPKADKPTPLVVLIHGGGWKKGSKDQEETKAHWFVERGYACAAVQYRLSGVAKHPAALHDCRDAVIWLREHAEDYNFDPDRFASFGGSAGAHLAALHATAVKDPRSKVQAVIIVAGPTDCTTERAAVNSRVEGSNYQLFLGGSIDEMPEKYREISPVHQATKKTPPCLILTENKPDAGESFVARLEELGIAQENYVLTGTLHASWNWEPWFTFTMEKSDAFLKRHLK